MSEEKKGILGYLAAGAVAVGVAIGIVGFFTPSALKENADRSSYYSEIDESAYSHPMVGKWLSVGGAGEPFGIVILPQGDNDPKNDKFEGHTSRRVWKGWQDGDSLQLYYMPQAAEMNPEIPPAVRQEIDGELEWRLDLTPVGEDEYDRRLKAVWQRGEVEWDESGKNGKIIGAGKPLEFELVYDPLLLITQEGSITIAMEQANPDAEGDDVFIPVSAMLQDQRVYVSVIMPQREAERVGPALTVTFNGTESGARETLELKASTPGLFGAPVRYSHQFPVTLGECGGERPRYKPAVLSMNWLWSVEGEGSCLDFDGQSGEVVEILYRNAAYRFNWYPTWVQAAVVGQSAQIIRHRHIFEGVLESSASGAAKKEARKKLQMIENYGKLMQADFLTDLHRLAIGELYLGGTLGPSAFREPRTDYIGWPPASRGLLYYTDADFKKLAGSTARLTIDSESTMWKDALALYAGEDIGTKAAEGVRAMKNVSWTTEFSGDPEQLRPQEGDQSYAKSDEAKLVYSAIRAASSKMLNEVAHAYYQAAMFTLYDSAVNTAPFVGNIFVLATGTDHFGRKVNNLEYWLSAVSLGSEMLLSTAFFMDVADTVQARVGKRSGKDYLKPKTSKGAPPKDMPIRVRAKPEAPSVSTVSRAPGGAIQTTKGAAAPPDIPPTVPAQAVEDLLAVRFDVPDQRIRLERSAKAPAEKLPIRLAPEVPAGNAPARPAPIAEMPSPTASVTPDYGPNARGGLVDGNAGAAFALPPPPHADRLVAANYALWKQKGTLINDAAAMNDVRMHVMDAVSAGDVPVVRAAAFGATEAFPHGLVDRYMAAQNMEIATLSPARNRVVTAMDAHLAIEKGWTVKAHLDLGANGKRVVVIDHITLGADGVTPQKVRLFDPVHSMLVEVDASTFNRKLDRNLPHGNLKALRTTDPVLVQTQRAAPAPALLAPPSPPPRVTDVPQPGQIFRYVVGKDEYFVKIDKLLGEGATSKAYSLADHPGKVLRIGNKVSMENFDKLREMENAATIDTFGRAALADPRMGDKHVRGVKLYGSWQSAEGQLVEIVDLAPEMWTNMRKRMGGKMTRGQALAMEAAARDLNNAGYAWIDNHAHNFAFEPMPGGDRWRVVVVDPGGIVPAKGATLAERAQNARAIQGQVHNPKAQYIEDIEIAQKKFADQVGKVYFEVAGEMYYTDKMQDRIDFDAYGVDPDSVKFRPSIAIEHPEIRSLYNMDSASFSQQYQAHYGAN